jgi:tetratricopeptide (TPR) repeat protein
MRTKKNLQIGCGGNYKPEFINIDLFNRSSVDIVAHAVFLPFRSNIFLKIEAIHIIEHFDWVEVKYLLNEWVRILKNEGELILETPDLKKSVNKLISFKNFNNQTSSLQWLYGIDDKGMRHKSGFNPSIIKNFLKLAGFDNIRSKKPQHHRYEPGFRIECNKSTGNIDNIDLVIHNFRTKMSALIILGNLRAVNLLEKNYIIPIESFLVKIANEKKMFNLTPLILEEFVKLTICNPVLANMLFICIKPIINIKEEDFINIQSLLEHLIKLKIHQKSFTLWYQRKKTPGKLQEEFHSFMTNLESLIQKAIVKPRNFKRLFNYIASLEEEIIPFFDIFFILEKASILYNQGIKAFKYKHYEEAKQLFNESLKFNPDNYLVYWNLARIGIIINDNELKELYGVAVNLSPEKAVKTVINAEIQKIRQVSNSNGIDEPVIKF